MVKITPEQIAEFDRARAAGAELAKNEPKAVNAWYAADTDRIFVELSTGVVMGFPSKLLQGLGSGTKKQLAEVEITPSGFGLHWESLDADLGVPQLIAGIFGSKSWMSELGRLGGKSKSKAKAQASVTNGKLGGRPPKNKDTSID